MIRAAAHRRPLRQSWLALAMLALVVRVLVPAGFMVSATPDRALPLALVVCTGHGPLTIDAGVPDKARHAPGPADQPSSHDAPCLFAGHGIGATAPDLHDLQRVEFAGYTDLQPRRPPGLTPGRGLAAPPLPARGPPSLLI